MAKIGLSVDVFSNRNWALKGVDCSNDGVSKRFETFIAVDISGPFEVRPTCPALYLHTKNYPWGRYIYFCPVPVGDKNEHLYMMGGNFAYSTDSRFREVSNQPIPIHDRREDAGRFDGN